MKLHHRLLLFALFIIGLTTLIGYARGYRLDLKTKAVKSTGIISISAAPKASKVFINGVLKGATDLNATLPPGIYKIEVKKDGFTSWTKEVSLKGEVVLTLDVLLFPLNPTLSPLTNLGIVKAIPIANSEKVILFSDSGDEIKDGIYLFESSPGPLSFFTPLKTIILKKFLPPNIDFKDASVDVSPDLKQAIFTFDKGASYLLSLDELQTQTFDIGKSKETLLQAWEQEHIRDTLKILETFPKEIYKVASDSFHIISFSPDETKFLYQSVSEQELPLVPNRPPIGTNQSPETRLVNPQYFYVYDKKEDKNFQVMDDVKKRPPSTAMWHSDSKHIVFNEAKKISVVDYDGTNKRTVYSGPFINPFFVPVADGKIVILSNLNPENNPLPDLYVVGTK